MADYGTYDVGPPPPPGLRYLDWMLEKNAEKWVTLFGLVSFVLAIIGLIGFVDDFPDRSESFSVCSPTDTTSLSSLNLCYTGIPKGPNITGNATSLCRNSPSDDNPNQACGCYMHWAAYDYIFPPIPAYNVALSMFSIDLFSCVLVVISAWIETKATRDRKPWAIKLEPTWGKLAYCFDCMLLPVVTGLTAYLLYLYLVEAGGGGTNLVSKHLVVIPDLIAEDDEKPDTDPLLAVKFKRIDLDDLEDCEVELSREAGSLPAEFEREKSCDEVTALYLYAEYDGRKLGALQDPAAWIASPARDPLLTDFRDTPLTSEDCITNSNFRDNIEESLAENLNFGVPMTIGSWIAALLDYFYVRRRGKKRAKEMKKRWEAAMQAQAQAQAPVGGDSFNMQPMGNYPV